MSFAGQNLKSLRKLRGWTQEEFASGEVLNLSIYASELQGSVSVFSQCFRYLCLPAKLATPDLSIKFDCYDGIMLISRFINLFT